MRKFCYQALALAVLAAAPAWAEDKPPLLTESLPAECLTMQNASINMQMREDGADVSTLKPKLEADIKTIQSLAAGIGVTDMKASGVNYTIRPLQENESPFNGPAAACLDCIARMGHGDKDTKDEASYRMDANLNFNVIPTSKGIELVQLLKEKNYPGQLHLGESNKGPGMCRLNVTKGEWE